MSCPPLIVANEFITTLLNRNDRRELSRLNRHLTNTVLDSVCPSIDPGPFNFLSPISLKQTKDLLSKQSSDSYEQKDMCQNGKDPINPANTMLYGNTICQNLLVLNAAGLENCEIKLLEKNHNLVWPWSLQYHADRLGNNKRLQYFPLVVAFPESVREVSFWVDFAKKYNIPPCVRSGGHSYEGFSCSNPLVIDTTNLKLKSGNQYDIEKDYVDVSTGVRLGPLYNAVDKEGFIIAGGICPSVCVGGLVAGGGVGYFLRQFGYACDNLLEADIVLASGKKITCTADNKYSDLFRAIKGAGGGNFGIITRYRLRTHKVRKVINFSYSFAQSDAISVLDALQRVGITAPNNLSGIVGNMVAGMDGITVNGVYNPISHKHPIAEFEVFIQKHFFSLLSDVEPTDSSVEYQSFVEVDTEVGFEAPPLPFYKTRSTYSFNLLSRSDLKKIINSIAIAPDGNGTMFLALQFLVYGGFVNRVDSKSSVMVAREGTKGWFQMALYYTDPNDINTVFNYVNGVYDVVSSLTSTYADANVPDLELSKPLVSYYGADNVSFLKEVKTKYDPNNLFTFPQSIPVNIK
ncbi:FAD-dependent oxidoreductase [uncultured virus]|nr:FAD-dependent oxidoreductase [uncultured virus]